MKHKIMLSSKVNIGDAPAGSKFNLRKYKELFEDQYGEPHLIYSAVSVDKHNGDYMGFFEEFPVGQPELLEESFAEVFEVLYE